MSGQRTGGMIAIGVLNIVFGAIGALFSLLVVVGGGLLAAGGAGFESELAGSEAEGAGAMMAAGGGLIMLIGLVALVCWATLGVSGIGVIMVRNWGRVLSMLCGGGLAALNLLGLVTGGFSIFGLAVMSYGALLVYLAMSPGWKAAFKPEFSANEFAAAPEDQNFRAAA